MQAPYVLLGLAICTVWLPPIPVGQARELPPWVVLFIGAVVAGLATGGLQPSALLSLGALSALTYASCRVASERWSAVLTALAALTALALALHALPGFRNAPLIVAVRFTPDAAPFTQYLNFGKGAAGLLLLAAYTPRCANASEWRAIQPRTLLAMLATAAAVVGAGIATGYVRPEMKLPPVAPAFLAANLLFTCVAEEAFFRGLIQERITPFFERRSSGWMALSIPVFASALLFAAAHAAGGRLFVLLAAIAGLGYALAYAATRRIEAAVLTHFFVNAVHFIAFTYPYLER